MFSNRGFSLIEVMISIFIVGAVALLYFATLNTFRLTHKSRDEITALNVAQNKLTSLRSGRFANLPASGSFTDSQLSNLDSATATLAITNAGTTSLKQVTVTISWHEENPATTSSISASTLITQTGGI